MSADVPTDIRPLEPASTGGLAALDRALVRLSTHRRLLMIAAHPDDESTTLLTLVARGMGGEAAYLSLSRGEGGQNLIGSELGPDLGLLRSRELEAARQIDGARQFFGRTYDFGFTRSSDETFERWPKKVQLEDTMRVVRRFKPQVLMAVFPPTAAAGHGQHQTSGWVAEQILELSADADAFPQLDAEGLAPWKVSSFYRSQWWNPEAEAMELQLGAVEPFRGKSILQIALESRSQHRCQDMGLLQPLGDATGRLSWVEGAGGTEAKSPFAGVDTSLAAIADLVPAGELQRQTAIRLQRVSEIATAARKRLNASQLGQAAEPVLEIVRLLQELDADLAAVPEARTARELIAEKLEIANEALANAAQILADAVTDRQTVVAGAADASTFEARSIFWNAGELPVESLDVTLESAAGWNSTGSRPAEPLRSRFAPRPTDVRSISIEVPPESEPTIPYFSRQPRIGDLYDWSEVPAKLRGEPFQPPPAHLRFDFTVRGVPVSLRREVVYRLGDQAIGEVRRPIRAVPALEIAAEPRLIVWPLGASRADERLQVVVTSHLDRPLTARIEVSVPEDWPAVAPVSVDLSPARRQRSVELPLRLPSDLGAGRALVELAVIDDAGRRYTMSYPVIDYEHVRPTARPRAARVEISAVDIQLPELNRLGYLRGASDRMPELLASIGLPVEVLSGAELANRDLSAFDAIVVGSRAYEVDAALAAANPRLLDYARAGGLLIVQYQQYQFVRGGHAPFELEIRRPHDRVTDETAKVRLLAPAHPALTTPNPISEADWQGWVQERGLYFAGTWDEAYQPLLAMADPGGEEKRGALLVAQLGEGHYVYTGLAFFRQLPAGVAGAYRLFANLLALGEAED
ncbi:MAG: PIG-L family deacetylase [Acidobacteriota bacterium]